MRAISCYQPWSSAIVIGAKRYETRNWCPGGRTKVGQRLTPEWIAIHAGKAPMPREGRRLVMSFGGPPEREILVGMLREAGYQSNPSQAGHPLMLPKGVILGAGKLVAVHACDETFRNGLTLLERMLGDFSDGRFAWEFEKAVMLERPIHAVGRQQFWHVYGAQYETLVELCAAADAE